MFGPHFAFKVCAIYAVCGALWILFSDQLLITLIQDETAINKLQTFKGWLFVLSTAALLGWGLERYLARMREAERKLQEGEERWRLLLAGVKDYAILEMDPAGKITTWNSGARRIFGYQESEIVGADFSCFYATEDVTLGHPSEALREAIGQGRAAEEGWRVRKNGKQFWANNVLTPLYDNVGRLRGYANVTRDITERKQVEEDLRRVQRAQRAICACNQALLRANSEAELLHDICRIIVKQCGYRLAWVGFAEQDEAKTVRPVAQAGYEGGYLETVRLTWADRERGRGPVGMAIRTGQHFVVQNVMVEPFFAPWRDEAVRRGYASVIAVPLISEGRAWGVLAIYAAEPDAFDGAELALLNEMAGDVVFGIQALRTRMEQQATLQALQASEARYRALTQRSTAAPDPAFHADDRR